MSEEALREALIDLERARKEAEAFRKEAESLLSGLQILTLSESTSEMFARLLDLLQGAIGSSASFVMVRRKDGDFVVESSTDARFLGSRWPVGRFLSGVLRGRPKACFDVEEIAEWRAQPSSLRTEVASALHLPLRGKRQDAVLVCTHPERGFFRPSHLRLAKRLSLLASQALAHKDLQHEVLERARLFSLSPDMLGMIGFDGTLRCANPAWEATLGFGEETLQNGSFWERFVHPEDLPGTRAELAPLLDGKRSCATFENRCRTERNEWCWFHWSVAAVVEEELLYVIATDITERRTMEEALRRSEERYALAAMGAKDGLWDWDLPANKIYVSPRWNVMVGNAEVEGVLDREAWFGFVHPEDRAPLRRKIARRISENARHIENEHRILHRSGYPIWVHFRGLIVRDSEGRTVRMVGSQTDITERKRHEAELRYRARHDQLTGLANRTLFRERLQQVIDRKKRDPHHEFAVLFLDLDRFKHLNESLGHLAGDALLVEIARRLKGCVRKGDTVSRFGGDEFTILLHEIEDAGEAKEVAERIQQALSRPFDIFGQEIHTSASIGIALSSGGDYDEEAFLRDADIAMYRAKALGKARCELFDRSMHQEAVGRLEIETELRSAIEAEAFVLYYQPIVALDTLRPIGFEALIRWRHPTRGIVPPLSFIPIAEETGLILPIGLWTLRQACRDLLSWQRDFPDLETLGVSVNLSARQFGHPGILSQIETILEETGVRPNDLKLELTESCVLAAPENAQTILARLEALDITLCMDDFGTGYASLSYLHRFPFDVLKIDRSFIRNLGVEKESTEIVRSILFLAQRLDKVVIAEGVETEAQLAWLRKAGCPYAQGYLFAKPLPPEKVAEYLAGTSGFVPLLSAVESNGR